MNVPSSTLEITASDSAVEGRFPVKAMQDSG
jgi:hypothetical protein